MNAADILHYGQGTLLDTIADMPESAWEVSGVCGVWSAQDIVAHLTSYERLLVEILSGYLDGGPTPLLNQFTDPQGNFNDAQVAQRKEQTISATLAELDEAHTQTLTLLARIPDETRRQPGTLPWYGTVYALDDLLVYQYYGHKREHSAQIAVFRDRLARA